MSNLVPTPRTDKNGRTVIRHMKQEGRNTSSSLAAAAPSLQHSKPPMSDAEFLYYLDSKNGQYQEHDDYYQRALQKIVEFSPTVKEDVVALYEMGNEKGSLAVLELLQENLDTIVYQWTRNQIVASRVDGMEHHLSLKESLSVYWSVGSLSSEADKTFYSLSSGVRQAVELHKALSSDDSTKQTEDDLPYWRAVSAATLIMGYESRVDLTPELIRERREMVEWLESKEYLGDIIRVGLERGLKDMDSIKTILESDSPASLSSGAL